MFLTVFFCLFLNKSKSQAQKGEGSSGCTYTGSFPGEGALGVHGSRWLESHQSEPGGAFPWCGLGSWSWPPKDSRARASAAWSYSGLFFVVFDPPNYAWGHQQGHAETRVGWSVRRQWQGVCQLVRGSRFDSGYLTHPSNRAISIQRPPEGGRERGCRWR